MKPNKAVREIMAKMEVRPSVLASRVGISNNVLNMRLNQENISTDKLNELLRAMDYKIVVVPRDATKVSDGIVID